MDRKQKNGLRKLLKLATFLKRKKFKDGQFDMNNWWTQEKCGTTGCAIGWGTTIPSFRRAGLKLISKYEDPNTLTVAFRGDTDFDAIAEFFNIEYYEARSLFYPNGYNHTRDCVVNTIRVFVKEKKNGNKN